jgi:hypothetical protein
MPEQQKNGTTCLFAAIGARTQCGRWGDTVMTNAAYKGLVLVCVGDMVKYEDGSQAAVMDGAEYAATCEGQVVSGFVDASCIEPSNSSRDEKGNE